MKKILKFMAVVFGASILLCGAFSYRNHRLQEHLADEILRFHVIANSNTEEDQNLKLKIRNKIGSFMQDELEGVHNLKECEAVVNDHLAEIENYAREVIAQEGFHYPVKAEISDTSFPVKTYGNYTFPKGEYRALRIVIGEGRGENWWCVMYPNLCFSNSVYEVIEEDAREELQAVLSQEEYAEIMAKGKIKVKFRLLERWM